LYFYEACSLQAAFQQMHVLVLDGIALLLCIGLYSAFHAERPSVVSATANVSISIAVCALLHLVYLAK
jgi:hypothetical protein